MEFATGFDKKQPCQNCPYRKDAPIAHWHISEFAQLLESEKSQFGTVYGCHKGDGQICVGWLMNQNKRRLPSIALRMALIKHNINSNHFSSLQCNSEMFHTVEEMVEANYPELL